MQIEYQPYKGVRDFYPEDWRVQNYIFGIWSQVLQSYGYERYDASVLEYLDIYELKQQANLEILKEQIYTFVDRGDRRVALRPEMTPTVARMIASRRLELSYPLRWYSIPNVFRYERPQRGRLREHWQLNVDCFGLEGIDAELEVILIACDILKSFGARSNMYAVKVSSRRLLETVFKDFLRLNQVQVESLFLLFDRFDKMGKTAFAQACKQLLTSEESVRKKQFAALNTLLNCSDLSKLPDDIQALPACKELRQLLDNLKSAGVSNAVLDFKVVRGFDYYTGIVFEIFDRASENKRSMFGGGRYDNLLGSFGVEPLAGVGFGMGDVTTLDFLNTHGLLPELGGQLDVYVALFEDVPYAEAWPTFKAMRAEGLRFAVDSRPIKLAKKIEVALKKGAAYVLFIGAADLEEERFNLKHLPTGEEKRLSLPRVISELASAK